MSVLKTSLAYPSRIQGIYRYLLHCKNNRETLEILAKRLSPDELVKDKPSLRPMFEASLREGLKCGLFIKEELETTMEIAINSKFYKSPQDLQKATEELPNILANLLFSSGNEDEYDFALNCAWYLSQNIYNSPKNWAEIQEIIHQQNLGHLLKLTSDRLYVQLTDWMSYLGLGWYHIIDKNQAFVPDPTVYFKRNIESLFNEPGEKIPLREFISRLAKKCPLFETGHFRDTIEEKIGKRQPNCLSTSTAFALFRLQDEGYIELIQESDSALMLLPKAQGKVDNESRISHIILIQFLG